MGDVLSFTACVELGAVVLVRVGHGDPIVIGTFERFPGGGCQRTGLPGGAAVLGDWRTPLEQSTTQYQQVNSYSLGRSR